MPLEVVDSRDDACLNLLIIRIPLLRLASRVLLRLGGVRRCLGGLLSLNGFQIVDVAYTLVSFTPQSLGFVHFLA